MAETYMCKTCLGEGGLGTGLECADCEGTGYKHEPKAKPHPLQKAPTIAECRRCTLGQSITDAVVAAEREPLLDVIESCFSVGEIRFGHNGLATTVRGKVLRVLIDAGRIDESGAAIRAEDG